MKYATNIFTRILSGLVQQGLISRDKRTVFVKTWMDAQKENDTEKLKMLLNELFCTTENSVWRTDLSKAIEALD